MPKVELMRPEVTLTADLSVNTADTWRAVQRVNTPPKLFRHHNDLVWVNQSESGVGIRSVNPIVLQRFCTDNLVFLTHIPNAGPREPQYRNAPPPMRLFQNMLAGPSMPVPELDGIVNVPVFTREGILQTTPGYSAETRLLYDPPTDLHIPSVDEYPDEFSRDLARSYILDLLLVDFPFDGDASRAHAVAALLLPFLRPMIDGPTPLHLISKPKAGTGAGLLADVLSHPGAGWPNKITLPRDEGERRRTLFALLRAARGAIQLDNVETLEGAVLSSLLTEVFMEDRVVGSSNIARVPNRVLWLASGNNPELSDELACRIVRIHLDAGIEHPDLGRNFVIADLREWSQSWRGELVGAALTLIRAWVCAGRPAGRKTLGGFESWGRTVGGVLEVAGIPGFLEGVETSRTKTDLQTQSIKGFVQAWYGSFGRTEVAVNQLLPLAGGLDLGTGNERSRQTRLGQMLGERADQRFGDLAIRRGSYVNGHQCWCLAKDDAHGRQGGDGGPSGRAP